MFLGKSETSYVHQRQPTAEDVGSARSEYGPKSTKYTDPFGRIMAPGVFGERFCELASAKQVSPQRGVDLFLRSGVKSAAFSPVFVQVVYRAR